MRRIAVVGLVVASCAAPATPVVQLPAQASASAAPPRAPRLPDTCELRFDACRRVGEPVRVSGTSIGQSPDLAWDGHEALVTFDAPGHGVELAAVDLDGRILWMEALPGTNARVAWNPRARAGLVVTSDTIAWLGSDGKPVRRTNAPHVVNVTFDGSPFATEAGFLVASGVASHASSAPPIPFSVAVVGAPADTIAWKRVDDDGIQSPPVGGPTGAVEWIVTRARKATARLFPVSPAGDLGAPIKLTNPPGMRAVAVVGERHEPVVLFADEAEALWSVAVHGGSAAAPEKVGVTSRRSATAAVLRLGDRLLLGADKIGDSPGVALAPYDAATSPHIGAPLAIGPDKSQHLRVVPTDRGFVAVWNIADEGAPLVTLMNHAPVHGLSTMLAVYGCCPSPALLR